MFLKTPDEIMLKMWRNAENCQKCNELCNISMIGIVKRNLDAMHKNIDEHLGNVQKIFNHAEIFKMNMIGGSGFTIT